MTFDPKKLTITVLSANAGNASRDKGILTRMHFAEVRAYPTFKQSEDHFRSGAAQIALIDSSLGDMDGLECLRKLSRDREMAVRALVMVTSECRQDYVMDAVSAGCSGYVIRPYSLETLEKHIRAAWNSLSAGEIEQEMLDSAKAALWRQDFDAAIAEFEEVVSEDNEALEYFNKGMEYLRAGKFGKAIIAFNKALALNELYAEAYKGLAYAHKGKGDPAAYQEHLRKAADLFAMQDKLQELREVFVEILKDDPEAVNPYNTLGVKLRRAGDYLGALHAYSQALELTPTDENLLYNIAKACIYSGDNASALGHLRKALALRPDFREAAELADRLEKGEGAISDQPVQPRAASGDRLMLD
ncbi:MAG: tetratricopeptide repeat protein [Thermodesulfobacteriota bacterium]